MPEPRKILFLLGSTIGDSVCLTGAIRVLKQNYPTVTIDVLAPNPFIQELFLYNKDVSQVYLAPGKEALKELSQAYDFAIIFPISATPKLYPYLRTLCVKTILPVYGRGLIVESALDAITALFPECLGKMPEKYYVDPQPQHFQEAEQILRNAGAKLDGKEILIGCHIGYSSLAQGKRGWWQFIRKKYGSRAWLPDKYADLLAQLVGTNPSIRFVLTGTEAEIPIIKRVFKKHARYCYNIAGKSSSLLTLAAIM
ncbi:MAG: hypothetical protein KJ588_05055, partial [Gammaproteobacteria bacterium]|nr:hypothetical protein [Gammaproteobacteria bacterium]